MVVHYFTLAGIATELDRMFGGSVIKELFTQQKNELCIVLEPAGEPATITVSIEPGSSYIFWRHNASRARRNSTDLFPGAAGAAITRVTVHPSDRTIVADLDNGRRLLFSLYNTATGNIFLADDSDGIVDSFKHSKSVSGTGLVLRAGESGDALATEQEFAAKLLPAGGKGVLQSLKTILPLFGTLYAREAVNRAALGEESAVESLSGQDLALLFNSARSIMAECARGTSYMYTHGKREPVLACCPMRHLADWTMREFPSVNDGVRTVVSVKSQAQGSDQEQDGLMKKLLARRERLEKSLRTTRQQVDESRRAAEYTRNGNLLMANLHLMSKGPDAIEVEDILGDGGKVRIALSASLTPAENAERYFTRARKARGSGEEAATRVKEIERDLASLEAFIARFAGCVDDEERERFRKEHGDDLAAMNITEKPAVQERVPYRIFAVPGGYEVWVGKSSSDNDELTFHYAKQQDLWFHVRGASGSHAILRVPGKDQVVPKEAILAAARIAAYYSKMKNANTVPVAYCERKYVRKPKGAKPGTVTLEREKVVFVDPSLP